MVSIHDLWGCSGEDVFAVGGGGMIQHFDGSKWRLMTSGTSENLLAIWGLPSGELWTASAHAVLYYDRTSWREILTTDETIRDIWASSHEDVFAVGGNGAVLHYDGQEWELTRQAVGQELTQIFGTASNDVYAGGEEASTLYHFDGMIWQPTSLPAFNLVITGLWASSATHVFAVGYRNDEGIESRLMSFDGTVWHSESLPCVLPYNRPLESIYGSRDALYVGGNDRFFTHSGGSWRSRGSEGDSYSDVFADSEGSFVITVNDGTPVVIRADGWPYTLAGSFDVVDTWGSGLNDLFLVGKAGNIDHFDGNSRTSMESNTTVHLAGVWGRSATDVYAVGDSGTVLHYGGQSWQRMESGTTERLRAIWGNTEMAIAVGDHGTVLHFEDGHWAPVDVPTTMNLTSVWGFSSQDIYAVGPRVVLHFDGSVWTILSSALGGKQVWGRPGDGLYMVATDGQGDRSLRILRYRSP